MLPAVTVVASGLFKVGSFLMTNPIGQQIGLSVATAAFSALGKSDEPNSQEQNNKVFTRENIAKVGLSAVDAVQDPSKRAVAANTLNNLATLRNALRDDGVKSLLETNNLELMARTATTVKDVFSMGQENRLSLPLEQNMARQNNYRMGM